ncbi:MAG: hypothetical protein M1817_006416 [Caeruleum heppii]|nr:MAG: hypothetical protein M1817_006416 [Caeruleum heppii]
MVKRSRQDSVSSSSDLASTTSPSPSSDNVNLPADKEDVERNTKYTHLDQSSTASPPVEVMQCSLAPHQQALLFSSYQAYDVHYAEAHVNRCVECRKNFPTEHFLGLHIEENHDPLNAVRKTRGERTYRCFVEDCDRKCSTPQKRRRHMIDKHLFPRNYDFFIINDGVDGRSSMLRTRGHQRRNSAAAHAAQIAQRAKRRNSLMEASKQPQPDQATNDTTHNIPTARKTADASDDDSDDDVSDASTPPPQAPSGTASKNGTLEEDVGGLTNAMASLKFVPPSIRFGRRRGGGLGTR